MERSTGAVPGAVPVSIGNSEVPFPDGDGGELASSEVTEDVTGDSDATADETTGAAPTVTVTVFADVTVTVAFPHPPAAALPVIEDSLLLPPAL